MVIPFFMLKFATKFNFISIIYMKKETFDTLKIGDKVILPFSIFQNQIVTGIDRDKEMIHTEPDNMENGFEYVNHYSSIQNTVPTSDKIEDLILEKYRITFPYLWKNYSDHFEDIMLFKEKIVNREMGLCPSEEVLEGMWYMWEYFHQFRMKKNEER